MKPIHEQEREVVCTGLVATPDGETVAETYSGLHGPTEAEHNALAQFISAAPDMARALLGLLSLYDVGLAGSHDNVGWEKARAALRKAGVQP